MDWAQVMHCEKAHCIFLGNRRTSHIYEPTHLILGSLSKPRRRRQRERRQTNGCAHVCVINLCTFLCRPLRKRTWNDDQVLSSLVNVKYGVWNNLSVVILQLHENRLVQFASFCSFLPTFLIFFTGRLWIVLACCFNTMFTGV